MTEPCHVCGLNVPGIHYHHVVPQSDGGTNGPQVPLCGTCHGLVHGAAKKIQRSTSPNDYFKHLTQEQHERALNLASIIARADQQQPPNQRPIFTATCTRLQMQAFDKYKHDHGFTSREAAFRQWLQHLVRHYGLEEDNKLKLERKTVRFQQVRTVGQMDDDATP